jgi:O-methyltransferase involved in polyketide biosynthesis
VTESPGIDITVPHPARVYDYWLGGKDNYRADREAAAEAIKIFPNTVESARSCRAFLSRVVAYLTAEAGIRQFLDLGSGLPSAQNVHEVAQSIAPESRVVYVDHDPVVLLHARALLRSSPEGATGYIQADIRSPEAIVAKAAETLDFSQPVAVMLLAVLHFVTDAQDPARIIRAVMDSVPSGSYLAIGHHTAEIDPEVRAFAARLSELNPAFPSTLRGRQQVADLFAGLDLVEPGVVQISRWRPEPDQGTGAAPLWGGVARKP